MAPTIGIVRLPNISKSTLFNALTRATVLVVNYPFATIKPNVGVVPLSDARLDKLAKLFHSARVVPTTISFVDIVGIVRGASEDEGLDNRFLANIWKAGAICMVTHVFEGPDVAHVDGKMEPAGGIEAISTGPVLVDIQTPEETIPHLEKEVRGKKMEPVVLETAQAALKVLEEGMLLSAGVEAARIDAEVLKTFQLVTTKPFIYVFNMDDAGVSSRACQAELRGLMASTEAIFLDAQFEAEPVELEPEEAVEMLHNNGQEGSGLDKLARVGFDTLGLQTYLTTGKKKSRAWTIRKGAMAPQATGVIRTDFERDFIKAEIASYDDLVQYGSIAEARAHGQVRTEGKDYVMADGDVAEFRFNVWFTFEDSGARLPNVTFSIEAKLPSAHS